MDKQSFYNQLAATLSVEQSKISDSLPLDDYIWDSVAVMGVVALIDQYFNIVVDGRALSACQTPLNVWQLIERHSLQGNETEKLNHQQPLPPNTLHKEKLSVPIDGGVTGPSHDAPTLAVAPANKSGDTKGLVFIGDGEFAEIAYEYFTRDSTYHVCGFAVERAFLTKNTFHGLPVVAFDEISQHFSPDTHDAFVAITFTKLNRVRARLFGLVKQMGYHCATYISSKAFVWHTATLGENVFIFENNVIQHGCQIGDNVVLWSGNHVGHRTRIGDHVYLSSHIVISGYCSIGAFSFIGVNAFFADHVDIGPDSFVAMGCGISNNLEGGRVYKGMPAKASSISSLKYMGVEEVHPDGVG